MTDNKSGRKSRKMYCKNFLQVFIVDIYLFIEKLKYLLLFLWQKNKHLKINVCSISDSLNLKSALQ